MALKYKGTTIFTDRQQLMCINCSSGLTLSFMHDGMQIIGQVANCLSELHSRGWVHRDLKPGNIMFLPRTSSWTLIDFGLAARTGEKACLGFTLVYAAPEVIMAANEGFKAVTADPAMDAWALGVMAFELLTGRPIFRQMIDSTDDVRNLLARPCTEATTHLTSRNTPVAYATRMCPRSTKSNSCSVCEMCERCGWNQGITITEFTNVMRHAAPRGRYPLRCIPGIVHP